MGGEPRETAPDAEFLACIAEKIAESCTADLSALLGRSIEMRPAGVEQLELASVCERDDPIVDQLCRTEENPGADLHLLVPRSFAMRMAALQMGESGDGVDDAELTPEVHAAFQVVMKLVASNLSAVFEETGHPSIAAQDSRVIPEPASDPTWLVGERFLRLRFDVDIEPLPSGHLDLLLGDSSDPADSPAGGCTIYFLADPDEEPLSLNDIGVALGWSVGVIAPERVRDTCEGLFPNAGAVVVPWEVGGRAGLELVDVLRRDPQTAEVPLLMSSEAPTRAMVWAALRAGAQSFVMRPYDGEELLARLPALPDRGGARDAGDMGAPADADDGPESLG